MKKYAFFFLLLSVTTFAQAGPLRVPGKVTGFTGLKTDDIVDGAIVLPTFRSSKLLSFSTDDLIFPDEDMKAGPMTVKVPGNMYFPSQREKYGILPITLAKENFGFYTSPTALEEITALWFSAPFSTLKDIGNKKATMGDLLPKIKFKRMAYGENQSWGQSKLITLELSEEIVPSTTYTSWPESAPAAGQSDLVLTFQRTPSHRWTLVDLKSPSKGSNAGISTVGSFDSEVKVFFLRLTSKEDKVTAAQGLIVSASRGDALVVSGKAPQIVGAARESAARLIWSPPSEAGCMAILRKGGGGNPSSQLDSLSLGLRGFKFQMSSSNSGEWINPASGSYSFATPLGKDESAGLLFISSDEGTLCPQDESLADEDQDPDLLGKARGLHLIML